MPLAKRNTVLRNSSCPRSVALMGTPPVVSERTPTVPPGLRPKSTCRVSEPAETTTPRRDSSIQNGSSEKPSTIVGAFKMAFGISEPCS